MRPCLFRLVAGVVLAFAALALDALQGRPLALGAVQLGMLAAGILLVGSALHIGGHRAKRVMALALVPLVATYVALLVLELAIGLMSPPHATKNAIVELRGMNVEDPTTGFRLAAGWHGHYDDGVVQADYRTNARGDRDDDEPLPGAQRRVLLLGDSFAFGQALPRAHTIEAGIEAGSGGEVDAYNLGVPGYSAVHARRRYEQSAWWHGQDVVYLFFNNDVQPGNHRLDTMRVVDGYTVPRYRADGTAYDDVELQMRLHAVLANDFQGPRAWLGNRLVLRRLRQVIASVRDPELRRTGIPGEAFDPRVVDEVVGHAQAMQALAAARGAGFHVVVVPTPAEVAERSWSRATAAFVAGAHAAGLAPDEGLLEQLEVADYLAHDGHFDRGGTETTAALVLARLQARCGLGG